jgi:uncharacterized membrane protein
MIRPITPGHLLYTLGIAGLGILSIAYDDYALQWQPVPDWVPGHSALAYASGLILLLAAAGTFFKRTGTICALVLAVDLLLWAVLLRAPIALPDPLNVGLSLGFFEDLALTCGGWLLFASLVEPGSRLDVRFVADGAGRRVARYLFAASCLLFGLSHFVYASVTAEMIPAWLPERLSLAYLTGAGHFAAGIGILLAIFPRLAATLEAIMMSSFVLLVHIPSIGNPPPFQWAPTSRIQWTYLFVSLALAGSAWVVARSLSDVSWGLLWKARTKATTD